MGVGVVDCAWDGEGSGVTLGDSAAVGVVVGLAAGVGASEGVCDAEKEGCFVEMVDRRWQE